MSKKKILVLGAGPAGLAAAWKLAEAGQEVIVLEKDLAVGGICKTIRNNGYFFDLGGHRFITEDKDLGSQIQGLMGDELSIIRRKSVIRLRGHSIDYPLELKNLFFNVDKSFFIKSLLDYILSVSTKRLFKKRDVSFEDWVVNRFGKILYDLYFRIYTEKLWGISPERISADWAAQRISLLNLRDVFLRLIGKESNRPKTYTLEFIYPKMGIGRIPEKMAQAIEKYRGAICLGATVKKIILEGESIKKVVYEEKGVEKEVSGDWVVSTIPVNEFIKSIIPEVKSEYLKVANCMRFRSVRFMNLHIDTPKITENTWIYVPEKEFLFFRIQEPRNWSNYSAPEGKTSLILEIACNYADKVWSASDKELFERCKEGLKKLNLFDVNKITSYFTTFIQHGYPIYDLDYKYRIEKSTELLKSIANLITIGRQGLFRYNNMDHSIKMGLLTAGHILQGGLEARIFSIASESVAFEIETNVERRI